MGVLRQAKIERLMLPSTEDKPENEREWVDINVNLLGGDILEAAEDNISNVRRAIMLLAALIKNWSFTEEDGEKTAITPDNVARLEATDLSFLVNKVNEVLPTTGGLPEKKDATSSLSSPPSGTASQ